MGKQEIDFSRASTPELVIATDQFPATECQSSSAEDHVPYSVYNSGDSAHLVGNSDRDSGSIPVHLTNSPCKSSQNFEPLLRYAQSCRDSTEAAYSKQEPFHHPHHPPLDILNNVISSASPMKISGLTKLPTYLKSKVAMAAAAAASVAADNGHLDSSSDTRASMLGFPNGGHQTQGLGLWASAHHFSPSSPTPVPNYPMEYSHHTGHHSLSPSAEQQQQQRLMGPSALLMQGSRLGAGSEGGNSSYLYDMSNHNNHPNNPHAASNSSSNSNSSNSELVSSSDNNQHERNGSTATTATLFNGGSYKVESQSPAAPKTSYASGDSPVSIEDRIKQATFTQENFDTLCEVLISEANHGKLEKLLEEMPKEMGQSENVLRAKAFLAYKRKDFKQLYAILESRNFSQRYHKELQGLFLNAKYEEGERMRGKVVGAVEKYRIRKKYPLPKTIWDGHTTSYKFRDIDRKLLLELYSLNPYPAAETKKDLESRTGLSRRQIDNWYKNRRQRDLSEEEKMLKKSQSKKGTKRPLTVSTPQSSGGSGNSYPGLYNNYAPIPFPSPTINPGMDIKYSPYSHSQYSPIPAAAHSNPSVAAQVKPFPMDDFLVPGPAPASAKKKKRVHWNPPSSSSSPTPKDDCNREVMEANMEVCQEVMAHLDPDTRSQSPTDSIIVNVNAPFCHRPWPSVPQSRTSAAVAAAAAHSARLPSLATLTTCPPPGSVYSRSVQDYRIHVQ